MFRLGEADWILIKQQQQAAQDQINAMDSLETLVNKTGHGTGARSGASTETGASASTSTNTTSKEDREAAMSLFRKAKLWGIYVPLSAEQLENLQRDLQGKGQGLAGKGQGLGGVSVAVHEVSMCSLWACLARVSCHVVLIVLCYVILC